MKFSVTFAGENSTSTKFTDKNHFIFYAKMILKRKKQN